MPTKVSVKAYRGDSKTLLAFNLPKGSTKNLAGFTIRCEPQGQPPYFLHNMLQFATPGDHTQDSKEPATSSLNAPIHKFRWLHVPGSIHQGTMPFYGPYRYTVTARYFDDNESLLPIDPTLSTTIKIEVGPFKTKSLELGFTRGFTQSQAFVNHFGKTAPIRPKERTLVYDTTQNAGTNPSGKDFTFEEEYQWLGFTARARIIALLDEVLGDKTLTVDVFAYDLSEPAVVERLLKLAKQGRARVILDNAALHTSKTKKVPEDEFEKLFQAAKKSADNILRGKFGRYSHDKIMIVSKGGTPQKVLTGSTNFSVTGVYVNSNHILVFNDKAVAAKYGEVFEAAWSGGASRAKFLKSELSGQTFSFNSGKTPAMEVTFSPHTEEFAGEVLGAIAERIEKEGKKKDGSVLFAVMQLDGGTGPVFDALQALHENEEIFSFGISDTTSGIALYRPGSKKGVLTTGKPGPSQLPAPFNQVPGVGLGHQIHHKFVVCGFNGKDPVVYCGSSNLALGGEQQNGDNLIAIRDEGVATVFALEALALVDHFDFLDRSVTAAAKAKKNGATTKKPPPADKKQAAASAGWFLSTTDKWVAPYYDADDLHCVDRQLFG